MFSTLVATFAPAVRLMGRLRVSRGRLVAAIGLLFIGGGLEGATVGLLVPLLSLLTGSESSTPTFLNSLFDEWLGGHSQEARVVVLSVAILLLAVVKNALSYAGVAMAGVVRTQATSQLRQQLFDRALTAAPATLERYTSGEVTSVLITDAFRVNRLFDLVIAFLHRFVIAASYMLAIFLLSWQLTLVTVALGLGLALASHALSRRALRHGRELTRANAQLSRHVTEIVGGLRVVRTTASEPSWRRTVEESSREYAEADLGAALSHSFMISAVETLGIAGAMGLTALAHSLWLAPGSLDVPSFLAFGFGLIRLMPSLNQVYAGLGFIVPLVGSIEVVLRWLDLPSYPTRPFGNTRVPHLTGGISFENVSFTYPNGTRALSGLSTFVGVGEMLAVVGASGSGKSTLASLLLRLREPSAGRILFDGIDHWSFGPEDFHRAVGYVDQDAFMFNASIMDNVTCGMPGIGRDAVIDALKSVQLMDVIDRLPDGIDTILAERGSTLSGGQRQRLAIARAIVRNPQVLVLDEPTSALDSDTEQEVMRAIDAARAGRTTIIITHRESTVQHATRRLQLDANGAASEAGARADPGRDTGVVARVERPLGA